jgi:hypothetical protein
MVTKHKIMNINQLISHATLAPSGHNTQPWKFSVDGNIVRIYPDFQRSLPVVDPDNHALYISLGCALENLMISANHNSLDGTVDYFPGDEESECIRVSFSVNGDRGDEDLFDAIPVRQSNRSLYDQKAIPADHLQKLIDAIYYETVKIRTIDTNDQEIEPVIDLVKEAAGIQFRDQQFVEELLSWVRFTKKEVKESRDGLTAEVMGFPNVPRWLGRLILKTFAKPESEASKTEKQIRSSSLLMLFISKKNDKKHWVDLGRSFERVALRATSLGIAHAHLNMPCEVEPVRNRLATHLALENDEQPLLLIRFGYAKERPRSPRRPLDEVILVPSVG